MVEKSAFLDAEFYYLPLWQEQIYYFSVVSTNESKWRVFFLIEYSVYYANVNLVKSNNAVLCAFDPDF